MTGQLRKDYRRRSNNSGAIRGASGRGNKLVEVTSAYQSTSPSHTADGAGSALRQHQQAALAKASVRPFVLAFAALLVVVLALCGQVIGYVYSVVSNQGKDLKETDVTERALYQAIQCTTATEEEFLAQITLLEARGVSTAATVRQSLSATTKACGEAMLEVSVDQFASLLTTVGSSRATASDVQGSGGAVARNYTSAARSTAVTALRAMNRLPRDALPNTFTGDPFAVLSVMRTTVVFLTAAHSVGSSDPEIVAQTYLYVRRLQDYVFLFSLDGNPVSELLRSDASRVCLSAVMRPLPIRGDDGPNALCEALIDGITAAASESVSKIHETAEARSSDINQLEVPLVILCSVAVVIAIIGAVVIIRNQRHASEELQLEIEKRKRITESVQAFVPAQFLVILGLRVITEITVDEPRHVDATILASDIRAFTSISEQMTDTELFVWLHEHLANVTAATRRSNGFVEKYIGDAILAIFEEPQDALRCAIDVQYSVAEANVTRAARGEEHMVRVGVGVHSGPSLIGIVGDDTTQNTAVVGRAVDVAGRLEELTKVYGAKIIVTQDTFDSAGVDVPDHRRLGDAKIDGETVRLVEIFTTEPKAVRDYKTATRKDFEAAVAARDRGNIRQANEYFDIVLRHSRPPGYDDMAAVKVMEL